MTAIILAAGQGQRLRPVTEHLPKCLIPIGGKPILTHMLDRIERAGLTEVRLVVGFEADRIRWHVNRLPLRGLRVRFVTNERFAETNNLYSLWLALDQLSGPATILNGDNLFNAQILSLLERNSADAAASVDFSRPLPSDVMKAVVSGSRVISLGKTIPDRLASGNAIGLYRLSARARALLRDEIGRWVTSGRVKEFYVAAIDALASRVPIQAVSTEGLTWGEVDDVHDLAAAPARLARILAEERYAALPVPRPQTWASPKPAHRATPDLPQEDAQHEFVHA